MALQVEIWMWWWFREDVVGCGGMRNGISVGFGVGIGMRTWVGVGQNGRCDICVSGVFVVM